MPSGFSLDSEKFQCGSHGMQTRAMALVLSSKVQNLKSAKCQLIKDYFTSRSISQNLK